MADGLDDKDEAGRERLASEISAHQHAARVLPPSDEGFLHFVQAEVKAAKMGGAWSGTCNQLTPPKPQK
jgi:hypothetical protein